MPARLLLSFRGCHWQSDPGRVGATVLPWPGARQESSRKLEENVQRLTGFRPGKFVFGITSNTLVRSSQSSSGPAGGASDGYGLGRGAAGPDSRCTTTAAGALRVIV